MSAMRWATPEWHESLSSTNTVAAEDPRPGRVVVAEHQTQGRGRRGRSWTSPPGTGLAISVVLPPFPSGPGSSRAAASAGWVPLIGALAVRQALVGSRWPVAATVKWPNDVLLTGRAPGKVCGILGTVTDTGAMVLGTGLNVDHEVDQLPVPTATSWRLARGGAPLPHEAREIFLTDYLDGLATLVSDLTERGPQAVGERYRAVCSTLDQEVVVHLPDGGTVTGRAADLTDDGALVVDGSRGRTVHRAGDVEHLRARTDQGAGAQAEGRA